MDLLEIPQKVFSHHAQKVRQLSDDEPGRTGQLGQVPRLGWISHERWEDDPESQPESAYLYFHPDEKALDWLMFIKYERQSTGEVNIECNVDANFARSIGGVLRQMKFCIQLLEEAQKLADGARP